MYSKQSRRSKSKCVQYDYRNKWIKTLTKNISCKCKYGFDSRKFLIQIKIGITINANVSVKIQKTLYIQERLYLESCFI